MDQTVEVNPYNPILLTQVENRYNFGEPRGPFTEDTISSEGEFFQVIDSMDKNIIYNSTFYDFRQLVDTILSICNFIYE